MVNCGYYFQDFCKFHFYTVKMKHPDGRASSFIGLGDGITATVKAKQNAGFYVLDIIKGGQNYDDKENDKERD